MPAAESESRFLRGGGGQEGRPTPGTNGTAPADDGPVPQPVAFYSFSANTNIECPAARATYCRPSTM